MSIHYEPWGPGYGTPYQVDPDQYTEEGGTAELLEDGDELSFHDCPELPMVGAKLALTDGIRRVDGWVYHHDEATGEVAHGLVGAFGVGAVLFDGTARAEFDHVKVQRLLVWGSSRADPLPAVRGGYCWQVLSVPDRDPAAPIDGLQHQMRIEERTVAEALCDQGWTVVTDGTLYEMRTRDRAVVGYVKTHHRRLLALEHHPKIARLGARQRTSIFRLHADRYSCYLRLQAPSRADGPWHGIVRLEVPATAGLQASIAAIDRAAGLLPRFAGVAWRDSRAPQNLQPIGALESHLRRLLGDQALVNRAAREAIALLHQSSDASLRTHA